MTVKDEYRIYDFSGGLNTRDSVMFLGENESPDLQNVLLDERGPFQIRPGTDKYVSNPVGNEVNSLYEFVDGDGNAHLLAASGDSLLVKNGDNWDALKDDFTSGSRFEFVTNRVKNHCYFVNGEDGYFYYDGNEVNELDEYSPTEDEIIEFGENSFPVNPWLIAFHKFRIWLVDKEKPDRVLFCGHDIEGTVKYGYFPTEYVIGVSSDKGEDIKAIVPFGDRLLIFTKTSMWAVYGSEPENFALAQEIDSVGTVSSRSVREIDGHLFFLSDKGVYMYDGTMPHQISQKIPKQFKGLDLNKVDKAAAVDWGGAYMLAVPEKDNNDLILQFNTEIVSELYREQGYAANAWVQHRGFKALDFVKTKDNKLLFASPDGYVREYGVDDYKDDEDMIEAYLSTRALVFGSPERLKRIRRLQIVFNKAEQDMLVEMREDFDIWKRAFLVDMHGSLKKTIITRKDFSPPSELFNFVEIKFSNRKEGPFKVHGLNIHYIIREMRV